jgi:hypothetical protein
MITTIYITGVILTMLTALPIVFGFTQRHEPRIPAEIIALLLLDIAIGMAWPLALILWLGWFFNPWGK